MTDKPKLTERQRALLADLAALQDAGLISAGDREAGVRDGYDAGSLEVEIPPTVTWAGRQFLKSGPGNG